MRDWHEVVVVGGGPCGILAARRLTGWGREVLLLEAGPDVRALRGVPAPISQPIQSACWRCSDEFAHLFVDDDLHPYSCSGDFHWIRGRQLGGRLVAWSGSAVRLTDVDFNPPLGEHDAWPLRYADLSPYYSIVEAALAVRGACTVDARTGRYESTYADWPPAADAFKRCVESHWPERQVLYRPNSPTPPDGWKDRVGEMPLFRVLGAAERSGFLTVRTNVTATRIATNAETGLATAVLARDSQTGESLEFRAAIIVLCASTIETTRLLLNSACDRHPAGLGNRSGALGRYLMDHASGVELTGRRNATDGGGDYFVPLLVPRYRGVSTPSPAFAGGYWWQGYAARAGAVGGAYDYVHLSAFAEVLPQRSNRVELSPTRGDALGVPLVHITYALSANERNMVADMIATGRDMLHAAGYRIVRVVDGFGPSGLSIHEVGTARMGSEPRESVVNPHLQLWDCDNVYVSDGSVFDSAGSVNPTLTMLALTLRACDHVASGVGHSRWGAHIENVSRIAATGSPEGMNSCPT